MSFPGIIRRLFANNGAGPKLRGDILPLNYGTCSTAAETAAKVVSLPGFALATGAEVTVSFTVTNKADNPTLNVNGTGAKPIQYRNAAISAGHLAANRTYRFVYDGSSYELVGDVDTNSTYTAATAEPQDLAEAAAVGTSKNYAREDHVHKLPASVAKLTAKRTIDGVQFDGSANIHHYGACTTAAGTAAKTVALSGFVLATGAEVTVKFSATNTAANPTLNVNNTGAKGIRYLGAAVAAGYLAAGRIYRLLYDGSYWNIVGDIYIHAGSVSEEQEALRLSMIGVPRYWRSTTLPPHHCWANGDFVEFADWPELKKVYDAGGFKGMLMAWDADEETQAANRGMWRPDAAKPTGLFTPNLSGQFFRNWALASGKNAGTWGRDEIRDITGTFGIDYSGIKAISGAFSYTGAQSSTNNNNGSTRKDTVRFSAASVVPTGQENVPPHVWQPLVIYLGRPAQV